MSARDIKRLLVPRTLALIGGAWTDAVAEGNRVIGFAGEVWRIHPTRRSTNATNYYRSVDELPATPDAAFVAVPSCDIPHIAAALARRDGGGFVCFAAGFSETGTAQGAALTQVLIESAGTLPFFGPNCYGFVNFFDRVALWPDQVVGPPLERGVAIICQSGTIALTLMFNERSVPIGYIFTVGNQTCLAVEDLIEILAADERVTAFGLYIEGIKDAPRLARAARTARAAGKPIAVIKAGRTHAAVRTVQSHTGALAGADVVFDAFCRQAGIARCDTLATLCETLKVFHAGGALAGPRALIMGASGGDMAMTADLSRHLALDFAPIPPQAKTQLQEILTERVTVANPLDFHTYIWFDRAAVRAMFTQILRCGFDVVGFVLDCPPEDKADTSAFIAVIDEFIAAAIGAPSRAALIASLPETLSAGVRERCLAAGVIPLQGQREALEALSLAASVGAARGGTCKVELRIPRRNPDRDRTLLEHEGKAALAAFGVAIPRSRFVSRDGVAAAASDLGFPVVIKAANAELKHKSDVGGVVLNVRTTAEAAAAAARLSALATHFLVEEMVSDGVAEVLVGALIDQQFGLTLVVGAGGVLTELLQDSVSLLPPYTRANIEAALQNLTVMKLLRGFRGKPAADVPALVDTILAIGRYAEEHIDSLVELDVNPVIVRALGAGAVAVDALIRLA
ncbi:MAG TPA: acetate--CoA ligase family protein [Steroidobacteraceae bacterium]